jgi:hypothetical protein
LQYVAVATLESTFAEHPLDVQFLLIVIACSLALIACAILVEASN